MRVVLKYFISTILLLFSVYGIVGAQIGNLSATPSGSAIKINWSIETQSKINHFEIYRSLSQVGPFVRIGDYLPHPGNPDYEYVDQELFKSGDRIFCYKVRVIYTDNTYQDSNPVVTSYTSSAAKRTWGSIKAMFR